MRGLCWWGLRGAGLVSVVYGLNVAMRMGRMVMNAWGVATTAFSIVDDAEAILMEASE